MKKLLTLCLAFILCISIFAACDSGDEANLSDALKSTQKHIEDETNPIKIVISNVQKEGSKTVISIAETHIFDGDIIYSEEKAVYDQTEYDWENYEEKAYYNLLESGEYEGYLLEDGEWILNEDTFEERDITARAALLTPISVISADLDSFKLKNGRYEMVYSENNNKDPYEEDEEFADEEEDEEIITIYAKVKDGKISEIGQETEYYDSEEEILYTATISFKFYYTGIAKLTLPVENPGEDPGPLTAAQFAAAVQASKDFITNSDYLEFELTQPISSGDLFDLLEIGLPEGVEEGTLLIKAYDSIVYIESYYFNNGNKTVMSYQYYQFENANRTNLVAYYSKSMILGDDEWTVLDDFANMEYGDFYKEILESVIEALASNSTLLEMMDSIQLVYPYTKFVNGKYVVDEDKLEEANEAFADEEDFDEFTYFAVTVADGKIAGVEVSDEEFSIKYNFSYNTGSLTLPTIS